MADWTYRSEYVRCGRRCGGCPHGPYWYRYRRQDGRVKKEYCGRVDPREDGTPAGEGAAGPRGRDWWEEMTVKATASIWLAHRVLGIALVASREEINAAYRRECMTHHPDRGGDPRRMTAINAAWSFCQAHYRWTGR